MLSLEKEKEKELKNTQKMLKGACISQKKLLKEINKILEKKQELYKNDIYNLNFYLKKLLSYQFVLNKIHYDFLEELKVGNSLKAVKEKENV